MWKYYDKNIMRNNKVAQFINEKGIIILDVFEEKNYHYSVPRYPFIESFSVSYFDESKIVERNKETNLEDSSKETLHKWLMAGCAEIEKNYEEQVKMIKEIIG